MTSYRTLLSSNSLRAIAKRPVDRANLTCRRSKVYCGCWWKKEKRAGESERQHSMMLSSGVVAAGRGVVGGSEGRRLGEIEICTTLHLPLCMYILSFVVVVVVVH